MPKTKTITAECLRNGDTVVKEILGGRLTYPVTGVSVIKDEVAVSYANLDTAQLMRRSDRVTIDAERPPIVDRF